MGNIDDFENPDAITDGSNTAVIDPPAPEIDPKSAEISAGTAESETESSVEIPEPEVETPEEEAKRKQKTGSQRAREKAQRLEAENEALRKLLLNQQPATPPPAPEPTGKPVAENFETHEAWVEALTDWKLEQRQKTLQAENAQKAAQTAWESKVSEGRNKFPDFEEVLADAPPPSPEVAKRMVKPGTTPEMIHYLATHLDEYEKINKLRDPDDVSDAFSEIKHKLKANQKPVTKSNAPPPITPVTPRNAVINSERFRGIEDF
jgi:hypothetical protein